MGYLNASFSLNIKLLIIANISYSIYDRTNLIDPNYDFISISFEKFFF